nr:unnamed protein product [Callosobruchus analis]
MNFEKLVTAIICYKILLKRKEKETARRKCWIKLWIRRRVELGACSTLTRKLQIEDTQVRNFVHINAVQVQYTGLSNKLAMLPSGLTVQIRKKCFV